MKLAKKDEPFPLQSKVSFSKIIESLELQTNDPDVNIAQFAKSLLKEANKYPILKEGFDDLTLIEKHKPIINRLVRTLFPDILLSNEIKGITPPFIFEPFYQSTRLKKIIADAGGEDDFEPKGFTTEDMYIFACSAIMNMYYNYPVDIGMPLYAEIPNKKVGITHTYRLAFNADMIEFFPTEKAKEITLEDYHELMDNFRNIELWKKKFPPNSWIIRGIGIVNMMDVTLDRSVANVTTNLLIKGIDSAGKIRDGIKALFNNDNLQVGFTAYQNQRLMKPYKDDIESLLLNGKETQMCNDLLCDYSYHQLLELRTPLVISDVDKFAKSNGDGNITKMLRERKILSFIAVPMMHEGEFLGLLELGASTKYELNESSLSRLSMVLPILCMAASRFNAEFKNSIEAVIQQECTTIHPSVKWKFEEEAYQYLLKKQRGQEAHFQDLSFNEVFPLYGQLDIRDSSVKRNDAIQADLLSQIGAVRKVLQRAFEKHPLPAYEELIFRTDNFKNEIEKGLMAGSELMVQNFFKSDVYPVFNHLKGSDKTLARVVEAYERMLDKELHFVYKKRKKMDDAIADINRTLAALIDKKQEEAQRMFPHYFERYKTDGLEYNVYIGESISQDKGFNPVYLRSLRLWQLATMCDLENELKKAQEKADPKLDIASLILVFGTPLSIHFRQDEKRFDVEGSYNARYEIMKKRVDKAYIHGTKERITQPGKIAIIYSNEQDAREYKRYINFLQAKDYLKKGVVEDHELQDLQGITGLRALRVSINYEDNHAKKESLSIHKMIEAIQKN